MRETNANFDTPHALDYKTPMYLLHFDGESTDFCNHKPGSPDNSLKQYLQHIAGGSQRVTPEEGRSSIGGITVTLQNHNDEITALLATDTYFFHRKKTTIKAGYLGMDEADMLTVLTGWVTGLKMTKDLLGYSFIITDPIKWMQRKIFRGAEDSSVSLSGNPINILLQGYSCYFLGHPIADENYLDASITKLSGHISEPPFVGVLVRLGQKHLYLLFRSSHSRIPPATRLVPRPT